MRTEVEGEGMFKADDDESIHGDLRLTQIDVDLNGLTDFRTLLERELDANMRPAVTSINGDHTLGVMFGVSIAGSGVMAAREQYRQALAASVSNLANYVRTSELLIAAIHKLTTNYNDSDLSAHDILGAISEAADATPAVTTDPPPAAGYVPPSVANLGLAL